MNVITATIEVRAIVTVLGELVYLSSYIPYSKANVLILDSLDVES